MLSLHTRFIILLYLLCAAASPIKISASISTTPAYVFDVSVIRPVPTERFLGNRSFRFSPDRFQSRNVSVSELLEFAFDVEDRQIVNLPTWAKQDRFDIEATIDPNTLARLKSSGSKELIVAHREMMRNLLAQRFGIQLHTAEQMLPGFTLTISSHGSKLERLSNNMVVATTPEEIEVNREAAPSLKMLPGKVDAERVTISDLVKFLSDTLGKTVEDHTHLEGRFNFVLHYQSDSDLAVRRSFPTLPPGYSIASSAVDRPNLFTAVRDDLGLELKPQKISTLIIMVDQLHHPSSN